MSLAHVHSCTQLVEENDKLKRWIKRIRQENDELKKKIQVIEEQEKIHTLLKQYVTTRNTYVQTDISMPGTKGYHPSSLAQHRSAYQPIPITGAKPTKAPNDGEKVNKMMVMHNNLMKRYEKELKSNMEHMETITKLNLRIASLEQQLKETAQELQETKVGMRVRASKRAVSTGQRTVRPGVSGTVSKRPVSAGARTGGDKTRVWDDAFQDAEEGLEGLLKELSLMRKERDKLAREKKKLKQEIRGLDGNFFDEVEDLQYALHRSSQLNSEYEQALRKVCKQFGVPFQGPANTES